MRWQPSQLVRRAPVAMALLIVAGLAAHAEDAPPVIVAFTSSTPDGSPNGFSSALTGSGAPPVWTVIPDNEATGGHVLAQTSADQTDYRFPLAIYDKLSATNVGVTVRFNSVAGQGDRAAGIAIRLIDPNNYYVVRANALEDNVNFYRVVKGSRHEIHGASAKVASNVWHTLGLKAQGDTFTIAFDGQVLFTTTDPTFMRAGRVALWTKADSVIRFDRLSLVTPP